MSEYKGELGPESRDAEVFCLWCCGRRRVSWYDILGVGREGGGVDFFITRFCRPLLLLSLLLVLPDGMIPWYTNRGGESGNNALCMVLGGGVLLWLGCFCFFVVGTRRKRGLAERTNDTTG